jgi:hypothetical protein
VFPLFFFLPKVHAAMKFAKLNKFWVLILAFVRESFFLNLGDFTSNSGFFF